MKVLIVDDNQSITEAISDYFESENIECTTVNDGEAGLEEIQKEKYDAVLLDIAIPKLNGLDIIKQLDTKTIIERNIIVITASVMQEDNIQDLKKTGVKEVLIKPMSLEKIDEIRQRYLSQR